MGPPVSIGNNNTPGPSVIVEDIFTFGPWSAGPYHTGYYARNCNMCRREESFKYWNSALHSFCLMPSCWRSFSMWTNKLSSFGSQKGYPIVARIANLPVHIYNGNTALGGGCVIGWLLIVIEDQEHMKKKNYVDFKNAVWHTSFYQLLTSVVKHLNDEHAVLHIHKLRTSHQYKDVLCAARSMPSEKEKEVHLKAFSLRNVEHCLHTNEEGLWGDHLWKEVKFWILDLGQEAAVKLDKKISLLHPTVNWDTYFFTAFATTSSLISMLHWKSTIAAGRLALQRFLEIMDEYIAQSQPETFKNWNFPKKHLISHVFNDILAKGATRNYNTKPNEKIHSSLQKIYLQCTNFKNVASQILHYDEWLLTSTSICTELDKLNEYNRRDTCDPKTNEALDNAGILKSTTMHAHLGLRQGNHSFSDIMHLHGTERAFTDFQMKLNGFLNGFLPQNNITLPDGRHIHLCTEDKCNPMFYGSPRYDGIMVKTADKPFFTCLVYMFSCLIGGIDFPLALIHPYDGAALANDPETAGDYFVIHTVDTDMFLQVKALQAQLF
ncbi:hypothetical protein DFH29DRAFT_877761 [Suillus ampliporus]|nr:hypothetical protein DFH29DRAFT_877761 [Suillus ampliporus]